MAKFTAGPGAGAGIDFATFDIAELVAGDDPTIHDSKHYKLEVDATHYSEFFGTGFTYNTDFDLIGGTLNEIVAVDVTEVYRVSGLSMSVATASKFVDKNDSPGFLAAIFAGADSITGSAVADNLLGFNGNDTVDGVDGNDTLNGGIGNDSLIGGVGNDNMDGGAGNDTYDVGSTDDVASESVAGAAGGTDTVRSSAATYTLGDNIEALILTGTAHSEGTGNKLANTLTGNIGDNKLSDDAGKDKLVGGDGNDTLSAGAEADTLDGGSGNDSLDGGSGADSMAGGAGNDSYKVDSLTDKVTETLANDKNGGEDTVFSAVTFTLGNYLDNLVLLDSIGPINGTGNTLDNDLTGNGKDNKLSGLAGADTIAGDEGNDTLDGGAGIDNMAGGKGNDSYILDVAGDTVTEGAGEGSDTVQAAFSIDLTDVAFKNIENATLLGMAALSAKGTDTDANNLIGNAGANALEGGGGNDTLEGGKGNDTLKGGIGDDVYGIDSAGDKADETGGTGNDTIRSSITVNLASYPDIENVELVGTGAINATGTSIANKLTGNGGANKLDGLGGDDTMDGRGGNDTYFVDSSKDKVSEDTLAGGGIDTVISQASFGLGDNIENLTLLGAALTGTGNALKNTITGNDLGNTLDGGGDIDKLVGGKGDDIYFVDNSKDVVTESVAGAPGGNDTVNSSDSFILGMNVENLILTGDKDSAGTGNALNNEITGDKSNNALSGLAGNDTLRGGEGNDTVDGGAGIDDLTGGTGNDTYMLDNAKDVIHESAGDSSDTVAATFAIDLQDDAKYANIENATLLGTAALSATGDAGNNILTGNSGANTLLGLGGIDTLDGGKGVDSLDGGAGNDVYYADTAGEKIVDTGSDTDKDEVRASVTFSLLNLASIENALLLGLAALNLTGNALANVLTGNEGNNKIDGGGGADSVNGGGGNDTLTGGTESDTLAGGKGNDVYVVDGGETIVESKDEGIDTVQSAITYNIASFANVENLTLTGTGAIGGTGNAGNNVITGNSGQNALDGGAGADTMAGGMGNDSYTVDDAGDKVTEAISGGIDTVISLLPDYTLPIYVENLTLGGSGDSKGTGNTLANTLTGNDGKNVLAGDAGNDTLGGGLGADTLNGGAGADTYLYAAKDVQDAVNTGDKGTAVDRVVLADNPFDWDVRRDGNDLLIQYIVDEDASNADFDPNQAIRVVDQYAGAAIAFFQGDFGEFNLFYGGNPDLTTVFTPTGLTGKDQGANAEVVEGTISGDVIEGGGGQADFLYGNGGNDTINSQSAADEFAFLSGGLGNDTLTGSAGTDRFRGDEGDDSIDGGAGLDRASYFLSTDAVNVDLTKQGQAQTISASQGQDTLTNIEGLNGSKHNDTLIGDGDGNTLLGLLGNDSISGGGGSDFLAGNEGNDTLRADSLDDFVEVSYDDAKSGVIVNLTNVAQGAVAAHTAQDGLGGIDTLINIAGAQGGDFDDKFFGSDADEFFEPGGGDDTIDGAGGFDDVDYFSSSDGVTASLLQQGSAQLISASQGSDTFTNIEGLDGSAFNDVLTGDANDNFLQGRAGADSLMGDSGSDRLRGGGGTDTINGGADFDQADYFAATAAVRVNLTQQGKLQVIGTGEGSDLLMNIEDVRGSSFNDTLIGDGLFNTLTGIAGNDSLNGGGGFDILIGGAGNDILNGGALAEGNAVSYIDAENGIIANLSTVAQPGVAASSVADGFGTVDKVSNVNGVIGSESNDTMIGGNLNDFFEGMGGDDSLNGGGGFNILEYFDSTDGVNVDLSKQGNPQVISASQGTDTVVNFIDVYGSFFNDTLIGSGIDNVLFGRDGDDRLVVPNNLFLAADGANGIDRLVITGSGVGLSQQDVFNKLFSIEEIDLTGIGGNSVTLNALDVLQTSETGVMRVMGNSGDTVTSQLQGWQFQGTQTIDGQLHNVYTTSSPGATVTLQIETDVNQLIS